MAGSPSINIEALLAQTSWLRRLAIHLVSDPDKANDLVHETWAVALEKPPKHGVDLRRWLAKVLRNRARNRYRDEDLQEYHERNASKSEELSLEETEQRAAIQKQVADAVYRLEEPYRTAITLFYYDGFPTSEIARRMSTTPANARQLLSRGREMLRARLDREFGNRKTWRLAFVAMLRRGGVAPVAVGSGKVVVLTAVAAALAILSLLVSRYVLPDASRRAENQAVAAVSTEHLRIRDGSPLTGDSNSGHREGLGSQGRAVDLDRDIHGVVIGPGDEPVRGATIVVFGDDASGYASWDPDLEIVRTRIASTESDALGKFAVEVPPGRPFVLEASAKGYATSILGYRCAGEGVTVRLGPGSTLEGRVTRGIDGSPLADTRLELSTDEGTFEGVRLPLSSGRTDESGRFRFENLPGSMVSLWIMPRSQCAAAFRRRVEIAPGSPTFLEIPLEDGATVSGKVLDAETKEPITNAVVGETWASEFVHVDADGRYVCTNLPSGSSRARVLEARADGYRPAPHLFDRGVLENFNFLLTRGGTLSGRILDSEGRIVPDAQVLAVWSQPNLSTINEAVRIRGQSNDRGRFELHEAGKGLAFTLLVRHVGSGAFVRSYPEIPGADEVMRNLGDIWLPATSSLRGSLVDEKGRPRTDWVVTLTAAAPRELNPVIAQYLMDRTAKTDDRGRFAFSDLAEGTYLVSTSQSGMDRNSDPQSTETVSVAPGDVIENLQLQVQTYGEISGRLVDGGGHAIGGIGVCAKSVHANEALHTDLTDASGSFKLTGLKDTAYQLEARPGQVLAHRPVFLRKDLGVIAVGRTDLVFTLEAGTILHGRLVDVDDRPIDGGSVFGKVSGGGEVIPVFTNSDGTFSMPVPLDVTIEFEAYPTPNPGQKPERIAHASALSSNNAEVILRLPK